MAQMSSKKRFFLSACEASADVHCAELIRSIRKVCPEAEFVGVGGEKMRQAGCELLENTVSRAAMIYNAFGQVGFYIGLIKRIKQYLKTNDIFKVIVCDSPAFNFHIAKAAKKTDIPTLFYVAPQLWAWAPWRIRKLRRCCDELACILPFEEEWFSSRGVNCRFVGNPLFDELKVEPEKNIKKYDGFDPNNAKIVLLPGSRDAEIQTLWVPIQRIAIKIKEQYPGVQLIAVSPSETKKRQLEAAQIDGIQCEYRIDSVLKSCEQADLAIAASGSATLQVAAAGCPMVVMYQSNKWLWKLIGQFLVRAKQLSLVNILAGKELVPEFMPYFDSIDPIAAKCISMLGEPEHLAQLSIEIIDIIRPLAEIISCEAVAGMAIRD